MNSVDGVISLWIRLLGSVHNTTTLWSLMSAVMYVQQLQGLFESFIAPPGPAARGQGRQQWWPELVVCTHSAGGPAAVSWLVEGMVSDIHLVAAAKAVSKGWGQVWTYW